LSEEVIPVVSMRGIEKRFPGVLANDRVDFEVRLGEIHALLGENGAGKTTLMNILYGIYQPDRGDILIKGDPVVIHSPREAIELGIGMVHQHFRLVTSHSVAENIVLGLPGNLFFPEHVYGSSQPVNSSELRSSRRSIVGLRF
jgi:ABC-type uncharacterized transport system ATPase subunit